MARDTNKLEVTGIIVKADPVRRGTSGNGPVTFSIAVDNSYVNKTTGEEAKKSIFLNCKAFGQAGDKALQFHHKDRVRIEGALDLNEWTDKEGNARKDLEVRVFDVTPKSAAYDGGKDPRESKTKGTTGYGRQKEYYDSDVPF